MVISGCDVIARDHHYMNIYDLQNIHMQMTWAEIRSCTQISYYALLTYRVPHYVVYSDDTRWCVSDICYDFKKNTNRNFFRPIFRPVHSNISRKPALCVELIIWECRRTSKENILGDGKIEDIGKSWNFGWYAVVYIISFSVTLSSARNSTHVAILFNIWT